MRRVVVTGLGLVSPFGMGFEHSWKELLTGRSAAKRVTEFEVEDLACKIAHVIPRGDGSNGTLNPEAVLEPKELRKIGDFILYGIVAADEALKDSGWRPSTEEERCATGVMIGSGIGGLEGIAENALILHERGPRRISPFFIPGNIINLVSGQVSIRHGLKGPNHAVVTAVTRLSLAGFAACRALSTERNETPQKASRPYDRDRDGFVMGEGAGVVVLEELEHAKARGAKIYAEVTGYGLTGDAYHITAPAEDGDGAFRCMTAALKRAKLSPADIDYINAHGTSTMADTIELGAVERLVGNAASKISMSSTKSSIGHLLGAAGA
ncbi:beta-ketoacyl synthase N-terminal-like domain-containing protein, partial [Mesorhizobium sp.]|uniref:beta-ketoacyl synthase N-terminal-like domain-containing protein n=1 Tax=Mesorhizobium sp. TaxID=1871066 RepID=UPI0025F74461